MLMVINILRGENCEWGLGGREGGMERGGWVFGREEWDGWNIKWGLTRHDYRHLYFVAFSQGCGRGTLF